MLGIQAPFTPATPPQTNQMVTSVEATYSKCLGIMRRKCNDYASAENPYRNFEGCVRIGLSVQQGIMVRLQDKFARLENLMSGKTAQVAEESIEDTIEDAINYLAILKARRQFEADKK